MFEKKCLNPLFLLSLRTVSSCNTSVSQRPANVATETSLNAAKTKEKPPSEVKKPSGTGVNDEHIIVYPRPESTSERD